MVTLGRAAYQTENRYSEFFGTSKDEKPTEQAKNMDIFYEIDTKKVYMFDEDGKKWIEQ